jgi:hypothetical protein
MKTGVGEKQKLASGCRGPKEVPSLTPFHCRKCGQYLLDASPETAVFCEKCREWTGTVFPAGTAGKVASNPEGKKGEAVTKDSVGLVTEITSLADEVQRTFGFDEVQPE